MNKQTTEGTDKHMMRAEVQSKQRRGTCLGSQYIFIFVFMLYASRGPDKAKKEYLLSSGAKDMIKGEDTVPAHRHPAPALLCTPSDTVCCVKVRNCLSSDNV